MMPPLVSVLIPVFNRAAFVAEAIDSISKQTLGDFEIIVIDDGSTDATADTVQAIGDPRIRLVSHGANKGLPAARNTGLEEARGEFIAWLDSDDLSRPHRLQAQVDFLRRNPDIALIGCCAGKIRADGSRKKGTRVPPLAPPDVKAWMLFRSAFQASGIMGRAAAMKQFRHHTGSPVCEDLDLYFKLMAGHRLANVPAVLIDRRIHEGQMVRQMRQEIVDRKAELYAPLLDAIGVSYDGDDLRRHIALSRGEDEAFGGDRAFMEWANDWMFRLRDANQRSRFLEPQSLALATAFFWAQVCRAAKAEIGEAAALKALVGSRLTASFLSPRGLTWGFQAVPLMVWNAL